MATLDILDFLKAGYETFMGLDDESHKKLAERIVTISPRYWSKFGPLASAVPLSWTEVKYTDLDAYLKADSTRASQTGVYVFVVKPDVQMFCLPAFVYYVGVAGEHDSGRPLRERLRQYIQVSGIKKRDRVHHALKYYHRNTYIQYAEVDCSVVDLSELETNLHGFFYPWAATRDFPAEIKTTQKTWGNV